MSAADLAVAGGDAYNTNNVPESVSFVVPTIHDKSSI